MPRQHVALTLADAFLCGPSSLEELHERATKTLGKNWRWIPGLVEKIHARYGFGLPHARREELAQLINVHPGFDNAWESAGTKPRIQFYFLDPPEMAPLLLALPKFQVPPLTTTADLARWLGLKVNELDWFADNWRDQPRLPVGPLRHYVYRWIPKRSGEVRLLEIPKSRLRDIQRRILLEILNPMPPHAAAHGFRRGHSCLTYAQPHVAQRMVIRADLKNFFPSIPAARIHVLFRTMGYPETVARKLTGLCTNAVPYDVLEKTALPQDTHTLSWQARKQFQVPHLPQGSPTSPALANLCAYRLDARFSGLAKTLNATYTRYADDLAFSGGQLSRENATRFHVLICRIALEEGFEVNTRKTKVLSSSVRQRLTGIVINQHPNISRAEFDLLKAQLHNCVRSGAKMQNRAGHSDFRAHLAGRIAHVHMLNPLRARKLSEVFGLINWDT